MASVLFCWELGAGFGHLTPHREVLQTLQQKGHAVHIAVRDLTRAAKAFDGLAFHYWQAPTPQGKPELFFNPTVNFTEILHNTGFGDPTGLAARIAAWRNIIAVAKPRVALVDYCPTALLALRGTGIPAVVTGTGFFIPPNVSPFPAFSMMAKQATPEKLIAEEKQVLTGVNAALERHRIAPLKTLAQIFHEVDGKIFRSLPEFDHYPNRGPAEFLGLPPDPPRNQIAWPDGEGPRVFAYLKPFDALDALLTELNQRKLPSIIACDGINRAVRQKHASKTMLFAQPTIDVVQMGRESHFAITNANLTTSVRLLLQGCPLLAIPLTLEQSLVTQTFMRLGVGVGADPKVPAAIPAAVGQLLEKPDFREAAKALAAKYENEPMNYVERAVAVLEGLLHRGSKPSAAPSTEGPQAAAVTTAPTPA